MRTKLSSKGQVVLPAGLRRQLGLRAGDGLEVGVEDGSIVLRPPRRGRIRARITTDPVSGLPVLSAGRGAGPHAKLTSRQVKEALAEFP